jgi:hypothetical protein
VGSAIPLSVFLGSVIRSFLVLTKIRFTSGNATGLKIQRIQELGSQIPVATRSFMRIMSISSGSGKIIYTTIATSGRGENMNNPDAQNKQDAGPIQAGKYKIDNSKWQSLSKLRQIYNIARGNGDWGDMNVPLEIVSGNQTRNSFYLHGGFFEGSAGCIDAGSNITNIYNLIKNQKTTYLYVKY